MRQVGCYLLGVLKVPDVNGRIVREELRLVATGVPVVRKSNAG